MAKRTKKQAKSRLLKVEALEQRQLLAGGFTASQGQEFSDIVHSNGNVYDQVLLKSSSINVTNDPGQITRVSFLDLQGDIVQVEFGGSGTLSISLDASTFQTGVAPTNYNQSGITYVQGLASITISGSDATTNLNVFSVGSATAVNQALFDSTHTGGDHLADIQRVTIVANPSNPNGSTFGSIFAGNVNFSGSSGPVGITAANVQVEGVVRVGDINATGTGTPTLIFGTNSQFGSVSVTGGDLVSPNGKSINNTGSYAYELVLTSGTKSDGSADAAEAVSPSLTFTDKNPFAAINKTITLTAGVDNVSGGAGNDTFLAGSADVSAFDNISGGDGTDTLSVTNVSGTLSLDTTTLASITSIENVAIQSAANAMTANLSAITGLKTVTAANTAATADSITVKNNATSVSITGGTTATVIDSATTDALTTVALSNTTGANQVTSDALTSLSLSTTGGNTTVTAAAGTRALTVATNGVTAGNLSDATATSLTINNSGNASTLGTVNAAAATGVTLSATSGANLTIADMNVAAATGITISGAGNTTLSALSTVTALTNINASAATGNVTVTPSLGTSIGYTGGAGKDTVTTGATTKVIATGDGDDTVTISSGVSVLGTGGSIDGGNGTDTISMDGADAATASASATFGDSISGFERLQLNAVTNNSIALDKLDNINYITVASGDYNALTLTKVASGATVNYNSDGTASTLTIGTDGTADVINVGFGGSAAAIDYGTITTTKFETVNITTDDTAAPPTGIQHTAAIADVDVTKITISGDAGLALTTAGAVKITTLDASGVTKGNVSWTAPALTGTATITTGQGNDSLNVDATTKAITVNAGAGNNTISAMAAQVATITTGAGNDTITAGNAKNVINAGDGTNSITVGTSDNTITGGTGADTVSAGSGNNTINVGAGNNSVTVTSGNNTITATSGNNTVVVGNGNNTITLGDGNNAVTFGSGNNTITTGAGNDTVTVNAVSTALTTVNIGTGQDTVVFNARPAAAGYYTSINGITANGTVETTDDVINFGAIDAAGGTTASAGLGSRIVQGAAASFANYLDAAAAGDGSAVSIVKWFQFNGNTYVVLDNSASGSFVDGTDVVVEITGLQDLSKSTVSAAGLVTIV